MRFGIRGDVEGLCRRVVTRVLGILLVLGLNVGAARAEGGLDRILNPLLLIFSSASGGGGCLGGQGLFCTDEKFCEKQCGHNTRCIDNKCVKTIGLCEEDRDCEDNICNSVVKMCQSAQWDQNPCTRNKECGSGLCNTSAKICQVSGSKCVESGKRCSKNISGMDCCDGVNLECRDSICTNTNSKRLGQECADDEDCDISASLMCDQQRRCAIASGGRCDNSSQCGRKRAGENVTCHANICQACIIQSDGSTCLLPLGSRCYNNTDCQSNKCDATTKVCIRAETACNDDGDCAKEPNPDNTKFKPLCAESKCALCVMPGNKIVNDYTCCDPAGAYEGSCLLGLGQACTDGSQCISGNCADGQCQGDGVIGRCDDNSSCPDGKVCCVGNSNLPASICNPEDPDQINRCFPSVDICGDNCCNGQENSSSCAQDCPQDPLKKPDWCTPNQSLPSGDTVGTATSDCRTRCKQGNICQGKLFGADKDQFFDCDCRYPCDNGYVCSQSRCEEKRDACERECSFTNREGTVTFYDSLGISYSCSCPKVEITSNYQSFIKPVDEAVCSSKLACLDRICPQNYRCCRYSTGNPLPILDGECLTSVVAPEAPPEE